MREEAPARGVPAGIGGKAAQSGEKGGEVSLCEFHVNGYFTKPTNTRLLGSPRPRKNCSATSIADSGPAM